MRTIPVSILAWFAAVLLTSSAPALAALPTPYAASCVAHQVRIPMLAPSGELHADLERAPWDRAAVLTGNLDWRRIRTTELPVRTYLYYDREALYLGYRCEVHGTKTIKAEVRERDQDLKRDEHFTFELDAGPTGRVFYRFVVNPLGTLTDSVIIDKGWN